MKQKLTQERLKEILNYNSDTGIFTWRYYRQGIKRNRVAGSIDNAKGNGYRRIKTNETSYTCSRLAFLYMEGYFPEHEVDHINRIRHDDRWCNLRHVTKQCNMRNCSVSKNNNSSITGVIWYKDRSKWGAQIRHNYKNSHLGFYEEKKDAARARWEAEKEYGWPECNTTSSAFLYLKERGLV